MNGKITFTSVTNTTRECREIKRHISDGTDYRIQYHQMIREYLGVKYAYSFSAGRTSLYALLKVCGIGEGDEVILQAFTCAAVPKPVLLTGAQPVYTDINTDDFSMDIESLKERITDRTKAVIVQHSYGIISSHIDEIKDICREKGIVLIEDCAHSLGAVDDKGRMPGTIGDAAFFSTDHTKIISTSVGGFAVTNNDAIGQKLEKFYEDCAEITPAETKSVCHQFRFFHWLFSRRVYTIFDSGRVMRYLRNYLVRRSFAIFGEMFMTDFTNFDNPVYTFPAKLSNSQAWVGISQMKLLPDNVAGRKRAADWYAQYMPSELTVRSDALLRMPLLVDDPDKFAEKLSKVMKVERWFEPALECVREEDFPLFGLDISKCPNAEYASRHIINLPLFESVSERDVKEICSTIRKGLND